MDVIYLKNFIVVGMLTVYAIILHSQFKKMQWMKSKEKEIKRV
jgi:hypothetical protein